MCYGNNEVNYIANVLSQNDKKVVLWGCSISQPQISLLESGKYQVKRKAAEKLAAALEVGVDWLLTGDESKKRFPADKAMVDWLWQHPEVREELWERMKE